MHFRHNPSGWAAGLVSAAIVVSALVATSAPAHATITQKVKLPQPVCAKAGRLRRSCDSIRLVTRVVSPAKAAELKAAGIARPAILGNGLAGGYTPAQLAAAYGVNPAAATTQTVAIVDAYDDTSVTSDLNAFNAHYGIPAETSTSFRVVNQNGASTPLPSPNAGWAGEISLDVQAVRAVCRLCKILLVEANSNQYTDLATAVNRAVTMGALIVSNSYGGPETGGNTAPIIAAYNHPGVAILASTGDDGYYGWDQFNVGSASDNMPSSPASLPTVIGVGGTTLNLNPDGTRAGERVWNDNGPSDQTGYAYGNFYGSTGGAAGSGCSTLYAPQRWQQTVAGYGTLGCGTTKRNGVDIAAVADYFTGFDVYCTTGCGTAGWQTIGGTSLASPVVAGLWGLSGGPRGVAQPALSLYGHFKSSPGTTYDVKVGGTGACDTSSTTSCASFFGVANPNTFGAGLLDCAWAATGAPVVNRGQCYAQPGYDGVSGVGTPIGLSVFAPMTPTAKVTGATGVTHGTAHSFSGATSTDPFPGGSITKYVWAWGDGTAATTTTATTASHTFSTAGTKSVKLTVTDNYGRVGTVTQPVVVG